MRPTETLTPVEGGRVRRLVREHGESEAARLLGVDERTLFRAGCEAPIARITAQAIRSRLAALPTDD